MWAPGWHPPLAGSTGPLAHAIHIASRAYWHGPARLRAVYGAAPALLTTAAASGCLHARGLLVDPASAFTAGRHWQTQRAPRASCALPAGHDIAVLDPHAVEVAILYAPHVVASPNVAVSHQPCGCGRIHAFVKALTAIPQGALLSAYTTQYPFDTIYVQFDGGCHTGRESSGTFQSPGWRGLRPGAPAVGGLSREHFGACRRKKQRSLHLESKHSSL